MKKGLLLMSVALLLTGCGGKELTKDKDIIKKDYTNKFECTRTEKIYNVIYYNDKGFFLRTEGESLITSLHIKDSKLITNYHSNIYVKSIKDIASVNIEEEWIKKKFPGFYIEGHLLTYDTKMANKYFLDKETASEELKFKKKEKLKEEQ